MGSAAPYGTRSSKRPGRGTRVNYAEDKDLDMTDYVDTASKGNGDHNKSRTASATASATANAPIPSKDGAPRPTAPPMRKPLPSTESGKPASLGKEHPQHNHAGAAASSSSTASSATTQQPSKKRKATAAVSTAKDSSSNGVSVQKPSGVLIDHLGATGFSETNMMTFENCGARLKNNILTADDGTLLTMNGKHAVILDHFSICVVVFLFS